MLPIEMPIGPIGTKYKKNGVAFCDPIPIY